MMQKQIGDHHVDGEVGSREPGKNVGRFSSDTPSEGAKLIDRFVSKQIMAVHKNQFDLRPAAAEPTSEGQSECAIACAQVDKPTNGGIGRPMFDRARQDRRIAHPPINTP